MKGRFTSRTKAEFPRRRDAAARHGADLVLDPAQVDVGVEIKQATDKSGVDVAIETSGSSAESNGH